MTREENYVSCNKELQEYCRNATGIEGDTFVGIRSEIKNGIQEISINFPIGYRLPQNENEAKEDIINLVNVLKDNMCEDSKIDKVSEYQVLKTIKFPISAYFTVILDYMERGDYYKEKVDIYKPSNSGKISMKKTIKNIKPYPQDNGIAYPTFMTRRKNDTDKEMITKISQYCVYESISKMGWLYKLPKVVRPHIKNENGLFQSILYEKLCHENTDKLKTLFRAMISVLDYRDNSDNPEEFYFGTNRFEYVWEKLIDKVFGENNKEDYFPRTKWQLKFHKDNNNSALEPDTIMIYNDNFYVLDAKYYRYGETLNTNHLPNSSSINKQITYGEYIANNEKIKANNRDIKVYNAFLMPFDNKKIFFDSTNKRYLNIGKAISDWKTNDKEYENVQGILVDVKSLINVRINHNSKDLKELSDEINKYL